MLPNADLSLLLGGVGGGANSAARSITAPLIEQRED